MLINYQLSVLLSSAVLCSPTAGIDPLDQWKGDF